MRDRPVLAGLIYPAGVVKNVQLDGLYNKTRALDDLNAPAKASTPEFMTNCVMAVKHRYKLHRVEPWAL